MTDQLQAIIDAAQHSEGWDALNLAPTDGRRSIVDDHKREEIEFAQHFSRMFRSEDGQFVLRHLVARYLLSPVVTTQCTQFEAGIREGTNALVRELLWLNELGTTGGKK